MRASLCAALLGAPAAAAIGPQMSAAQIEEAVSQHNRARREIAKEENCAAMIEAEWSAPAAAFAESWTDRCNFDHSSSQQRADGWKNNGGDVSACRGGGSYCMGENLAAGGGSCPNGGVAGDSGYCKLESMIYDSWHKSEKASKGGHFTQVNWHDSYMIGCGYKGDSCTSYSYMLTCTYAAPGNFGGKNYCGPKGTPCSQCPASHPACNDGLCARGSTSTQAPVAAPATTSAPETSSSGGSPSTQAPKAPSGGSSPSPPSIGGFIRGGGLHLPEWSCAAAAFAESWTDRCNFDHSSSQQRADGKKPALDVSACRGGGSYCMGENLAAGGGSCPNGGVAGDSGYCKLESMIYDSWHKSEKASKGGHFTQVNWHDSYMIGCGYKGDSCTSYSYMLTCTYAAPGNFGGKNYCGPKGTPCSQCPASHPACNDGLCARGPASTQAPVAAPAAATEAPLAATTAPVAATSSPVAAAASPSSSPVGIPSTDSPVASTPAPAVATQTPVASVSTSAPVAAVSTSAPVVVGSKAPVNPATTAAPVATAITQAPVKAVSTVAPVTTKTTQAPVMTVSTVAPAPAAITQAPVKTGSTQRWTMRHFVRSSKVSNAGPTAAPVAAVITQAPAKTATGAPVPPTTTIAPAKAVVTAAPVATTATQVPVRSASTVAPVSTAITLAPVNAGATAAPVAGVVTQMPVGTQAPVKAGATAAPVAGVVTQMPVGTQAPGKAGATAAPVAGVVTQMPVGTQAPGKAGATVAPVSVATTQAPLNAGSTLAPASGVHRFTHCVSHISHRTRCTVDGRANHGRGGQDHQTDGTATAPCSALDCGAYGLCRRGTCYCSKGWAGPRCETAPGDSVGAADGSDGTGTGTGS
eukprot:gene46323-biopygen63497